MSTWAEWWYGDGKKEEYESSMRCEEMTRSSLIDKILNTENKESNEVEEQ